MSESRAAYDELLATLRTVGDRFAGADWGLTDPVDVAEGLRVLTHLLAMGLETQFEDDAARPLFRDMVTPWRKALGDNADARYHDAPVHPAGTYHVRGRMAGAVYVSFTVEAGAADGTFPTGTAGSLNDSGFDVPTTVRSRSRWAVEPKTGGGWRSRRTPRWAPNDGGRPRRSPWRSPASPSQAAGTSTPSESRPCATESTTGPGRGAGPASVEP